MEDKLTFRRYRDNDAAGYAAHNYKDRSRQEIIPSDIRNASAAWTQTTYAPRQSVA